MDYKGAWSTNNRLHKLAAQSSWLCRISQVSRLRKGTTAHRLSSLFPSHLKDNIEQQQNPFAEVKTLGEPSTAGMLLSIITNFMKEFRTVIERKEDQSSSGDRMGFIFHHLFDTSIKNIDPFDPALDMDIRTILYAFSGPTRAMSVFQVVVKQLIARLKEPSLKCCQLVHDEFILVLEELLEKKPAFHRYPTLRARFHSTVVNFLNKAMVPTTKLVSDIVAIKACYINTRHPDFIGGLNATIIVRARMNIAQQHPAPHGSESRIRVHEDGTADVEITKLMIQSYFSILKRDIIDVVPKAIWLNLVEHAAQNLERALVNELYNEEEMDELFTESQPDGGK
ncbi:Dynamin central region-domain-containing protein [Mycena metata]|uniref:Dynamin central region-domain-containing protein n=1 Tax=Mycena metata TaxID=1033252 RepID=A0AAD7I911_9AGAR|nr:Dynamin central region-domain-containing protein [Mycena metata]